jgi:hypothetical protein
MEVFPKFWTVRIRGIFEGLIVTAFCCKGTSFTPAVAIIEDAVDVALLAGQFQHPVFHLGRG